MQQEMRDVADGGRRGGNVSEVVEGMLGQERLGSADHLIEGRLDSRNLFPLRPPHEPGHHRIRLEVAVHGAYHLQLFGAELDRGVSVRQLRDGAVRLAHIAQEIPVSQLHHEECDRPEHGDSEAQERQLPEIRGDQGSYLLGSVLHGHMVIGCSARRIGRSDPETKSSRSWPEDSGSLFASHATSEDTCHMWSG